MKTTVLNLVLAALGLAVMTPAAFSQGRAPSSEAELLRDPEVLALIGVPEAEQAKLNELLAATSPSREQIDAVREEIRQKLEQTTDPDERQALNREFPTAIAKLVTEAQARVLESLSEPQRKKLRGIYMERAGLNALRNNTITAELGVETEQQEKIDEILGRLRRESRDLGFETSDEQRAAFEKKFNDELQAVLTAEQRKTWEGLVALGKSSSSQPVAAAGTAPTGVAAPTGSRMEIPEGTVSSGSFGGDTSDEAASGRVKADPDAKYTFSFRYQPWEDVLQVFADRAGYTLSMNYTPPGTFSHFDDHEYTALEALDIINGVLLREGYGILRQDGFLIVWKLDTGIPPSLVPLVDVNELESRGNNELMTIRLRLKNMEVAQVGAEVEAMLGPYGRVTALSGTKTLQITDIGSTLRQVYALLVELIDEAQPGALLFQQYPIVNMSAGEAETIIRAQFGLGAVVPNVSQVRRDSSSRSPQPVQAAIVEPGTEVTADPRTNSLLITATAPQHERAKQILEAIDVSEGPDGSPLGGRNANVPYLQVYRVTSVDTGEVVKTVDALHPNVIVNEDGRARTIHIMATPKVQEEVGRLIKQLDLGGSALEVAVVQLSGDPIGYTVTLRSLFLAEGSSAPTIEADVGGRRLILRGTADQIMQIRKVLADLGEDGTASSRSEARQSGPERRFSLGGRDPDAFVQMLEREWSATQPNPLRVLIPEAPSPIRDLRTPNGRLQMDEYGNVIELPLNGRNNNQDEPGNDQSSYDAPGTSGVARIADSGDHSDTRYQTTAWQDEADTSETLSGQQSDDDLYNDALDALEQRLRQLEPQLGPTPQVSPPERRVAPAGPDSGNLSATNRQQGSADPPSPIFGMVIDDELVFRSTDEEALDKIELLVEEIQATYAAKPYWTVFYLQTADATEAAAMIESLIPASSVTSSSASDGGIFGGFTSSVSSFGTDILDATGLGGLGSSAVSLKIITDTRSNSLFVSGPKYQVLEVEEYLRVLDSSDIPASMRGLIPRTIPVLYADLAEVERMVKETFKPYTEVQGGRQQQNPLAMMMGGGGGGNAEEQKVRLTVTADYRAGNLVVACNESIFSDVKMLVDALESSAKEGNRGIRIVRVTNAGTSTVQQSLSSLMPRVSVSGSTSNGGSSSDSGRSSGDSGNDQADAFRRAMEARARSAGSGGGGSPFGGRTGGGGAPTASPFGGRPGGTGGGAPRGFGGFGGGGRGGR